MKSNIVAILALFCSFNLQAYSNFIENPYTPYPPGCVTLLDLQATLYDDNTARIFQGEVLLPDANAPFSFLPANLSVFRLACAEPNRSVVLFEFSIPTALDPAVTFYQTPEFVDVDNTGVNFDYSYMQLSSVANTWGSPNWYPTREVFGGNNPNKLDGHDQRWLFVLDNPSPKSWNWINLSATDYNGKLYVVFQYSDDPVKNPVITIPSTASLFATNPRIPLSGRLSGNWVVDRASDQGFVIAISELVPDAVPTPDDLIDSPLLMFLSWYTYDANGNKLWLTGSSQFSMGDTEVTIPIEDVSNGEFMGSKTADRAVVGSVTITGNNCNDLTFQYELDDIGLGSGTKHLQRLFSLETAGYVCRDLEARMAAK